MPKDPCRAGARLSWAGRHLCSWANPGERAEGLSGMEAGHRGCREGLRGHSGADVMQEQECLALPWPATVKAGVCMICRKEE